MSEAIPLTLAHSGIAFRSGYILPELVDIIDSLSELDWREYQAPAFEAYDIDAKSRRRSGSEFTQKTDKRVKSFRKINKGLAMELSVSEALTFVNHPDSVTSYCRVDDRGLPWYFATGGDPDIVTRRKGGRRDFLIVCEVSANRDMNTANFSDQLHGTLEHCKDRRREERGLSLVYGLLVNHADVGRDKAIRKEYLDFVKQEGLGVKGPIRLVPISTHEFATALRWLDHAEELDFKSHLIATALDGIHRKLRGDVPVDEDDWMANTLVDNIRKGMDKQQKLFKKRTPE